MSKSSSAWAPLLPAAMVGTQRHALPDGGAWPGAIGALIQQAQHAASDPALGALRSAAVLAACGQAGACALEQTQALPAAAPAERFAAPPPGPLNEGLGGVMQEGPSRLQHEALLRLATLGLRLPHGLLPLALEAGRRSLTLRAPLLPVLGARGLWLASQHDDWAWAAGVAGADADDASAWSEGSLAQRCAWLQRLRQRDAAAGRAELEQALPALPAKERADLLAALATGLGPDDEALLERLCSDRSREVRQQAQSLLLGLPSSARVQRAQADVAALLKQERLLLLGKRWTLDAPSDTQPDAVLDPMETERPKTDSLGERAWRLMQRVRQVPLSWWCQHMETAPAALMDWATRTDWSEALLRGWRDALLRDPQPDWCEAMLRHWPSALQLHQRPAQLMALLPLAACERFWQEALDRSPDKLGEVLQQAAQTCAPGQHLGPALSERLASLMQTQLGLLAQGRLQLDFRLRSELPDLACLLHPHTLGLLRAPEQAVDASPAVQQLLHELQRLLQLRQALHALPSESTSAL